jgi:hypothetical protein
LLSLGVYFFPIASFNMFFYALSLNELKEFALKNQFAKGGC